MPVAEHRERLVVLAEDLDRAREVRHKQRVAARLEVARLAHRVLDERHVLPRLARAVLGEVLDAVVAAIGDGERAHAVVPPESVRARDLAFAVAGAADRLLVRAVLREDVHEALAVAVAHEDVAVRRERDVGRVPIAFVRVALLAVELGLDRRAVLPHHAAIELGLDDAVMRDVAVVEVLGAVLLADVEAVTAALHLRHHRADELAVLGEHIDGVVLLRLAADGVRDVDVAGLVLRDAVRVAPCEAFGRREPVVLHAVLEVAVARDHVACEQRRGEGVRERSNRCDTRCSADEGAAGIAMRGVVVHHARSVHARRAAVSV